MSDGNRAAAAKMRPIAEEVRQLLDQLPVTTEMSTADRKARVDALLKLAGLERDIASLDAAGSEGEVEARVRQLEAQLAAQRRRCLMLEMLCVRHGVAFEDDKG
jgi:hypothetical protein